MNFANDLIIVKKTEIGSAVFANKNFKESELILDSRIIQIINSPDKHSIQIGKTQHALIESPGALIKHSCQPTARVTHSNDSIQFTALRDIKKGEQICFDYETTEADIIGFTECKCSTDHCRQIVKGFSYQKNALIRNYHTSIFMSHLLADQANIQSFCSRPPLIEIKSTTNKGRGVFATTQIEIDTIIEAAPVIIVPELDILEQTMLTNYYYLWQEDQAAIGLGYLSLYNHSYQPNAFYFKDLINKQIYILPLQPIKSGEEILINYNGRPSDNSPIWFEVK